MSGYVKLAKVVRRSLSVTGIAYPSILKRGRVLRSYLVRALVSVMVVAASLPEVSSFLESVSAGRETAVFGACCCFFAPARFVSPVL